MLEQTSQQIVLKPLDEGWIKWNKAIIQSASRPKSRDYFFEKIDEKSIGWLAMKYLPIKGIILMVIPITLKNRIKNLIK